MIDINELRRLAQAAKNSCESVEWSHEFRSGRYSQGVIISGEENILIVCGANYGCWRDADDDGDSQFKALGDFVAAANPAAVSEFLDRLEAAESECLEQARLNGMGSEREAALMAKLEAAEKERDELRAAVRHEADCVEAAKAEIAALRAKIEQMERQEADCEVVGQVRNVLYEVRTLKYDLPAGTKLYALPGAHPAPSIPDDVMRDAKRYRFLRAAKNIPISTEAARDPIVYDAAIDAAMLAAAPEAKP